MPDFSAGSITFDAIDLLTGNIAFNTAFTPVFYFGCVCYLYAAMVRVLRGSI